VPHAPPRPAMAYLAGPPSAPPPRGKEGCPIETFKRPLTPLARLAVVVVPSLALLAPLAQPRAATDRWFGYPPS
jgi:hypothetical protein